MTQDSQSEERRKNGGFSKDYSAFDEAIMDKPKEKRRFKIPALPDVLEIKMVKLAIIVFVTFSACTAAYQAITIFWSEESCIINGVKNVPDRGALAVVKSCRTIHQYR